MTIPVRSASIFNQGPNPVMCAQHSVAVVVFADYAIWCDTHGSFITPEQTTNFVTQTDE